MTAPMTFLEVDPRKLQINPANVRKKTKGIAELATSIAKIGVQVPLTVRTNGSDDTYLIVAGERRALAAVKAGVATVPVIVRSYDDDGEAELTTMLVENLHREDLTPADEAKGFEQLAAFGLPIVDIAMLTGRTLKRVDAGLTVAKSNKVVDVATKHNLTLEQLAGIVEVEDTPDDVAELITCAEEEPEYFDHTLERLRGDRASRAAKQAAVDKLASAGVTILDKAPGYRFGSSACRLDELANDKGDKLTTAGHKKCPGHAAFVNKPWQTAKVTVVYGCVNPKKHGHQALRSTTSSSTSPAAPKQSAADREKAAKTKAELEESAQLFASAVTVRRKFVKTLLARKAPPKGTLAFVVPLYARDDLYLDDWDPAIVEELLDIKNPRDPFVVLAEGASDGRLQVVLLAKVALSIESVDLNEYTVHLLKPTPYTNYDAAAKYLQFLASCGYGLAPVEQKIIDANKPKA